MSVTPERKDSSSSVASLHSVKNLVFGSTRRYSRAYDKPILQSTPKGPKVRVEMEDGTSIDPLKSNSLSADAGAGKVLNPEAAVFQSFVIKVSIGVLSIFTTIIGLVSKSTLLALSHLLGFMLMFSGAFIVGVSLFFWWSVSNRETVPVTVKSVLYVYVCCTVSSLLSVTLSSSYTSIPIANSLPQEASYYIYLATMLFVIVSLLAHRDTLNGMLSQETCLFVGLTLVLDFLSMSLFGDFLPALLYTQLPMCCMLIGLSLSLAGTLFPNITLSAVYKVLKQSQVSQHHRPSSAVGLQANSNRPNRVSEMSGESGRSSLFPRTSLSSFTSHPYSSQVSVCV